MLVVSNPAGNRYRAAMGSLWHVLRRFPALVALTFLRLAPFTEPRGDESRHEMLSEMTTTVSSVFLGLTVLNLFSATLSTAPGIIAGQPNFVKKVIFPLEVIYKLLPYFR